jgi:hypothetical protein
MINIPNQVVNTIEQKRVDFEKFSKSASDAMRLIVSALLFPTLALAYYNTPHILDSKLS